MRGIRRKPAVEDNPPHDPPHVGAGCSRCVAWRAARRLGITLAEFCQQNRHAYINDGDRPPFVPQ